ncbi:MAG: UDP-N-acetylmuramoyl-L-alanyl-D-glutamate--2,6-diaminopimelate ligase [Clostridia bacterium]|nr:UDP-N-acetylmuramoyl-L-alanyl-D-glutamate--2,6-diaminopimelate ligase [Clostridia bacterium]
MKLNDLIKSTETKQIIGRTADVDIDYLTINSRDKQKNTLFIAQKGKVFDGHKFVDEAIINGAVALVLEKELPNYNIPQIIVKNTRKACGTLASEYYGNPKDKMKFVGITGTNGKTSSTLFMGEILKQANKKVAVIGTLGVFAGEKHYKNDLTTPDQLNFHKILAELEKDGIEYVIMEASAHALALNKLDNIDFEVGILSNITQDHLDYFGNMNNYARAKLNWFLNGKVKQCVINIDDKYAKYLLNKNLPILTYGLYNPSDVFAVDIQKTHTGTNFVLNLLDNILKCETQLVGEFNIYNLMAVATTAVCLGISFENIVKGIKNCKAPSGRYNVINLGDNKTIIVDFAHTPDSLEKALTTAKQVCKGELFSVFGCGGDRDRSKRPIMGKVSESIADFTILTSDNPRFEKPEDILNDIEFGMKGDNYMKIADRKLAIRKIITMLKPYDIAVVCGKGGELYQDINGIKIPYDDFSEIETAKKEILEKQEQNFKEKIC